LNIIFFVLKQKKTALNKKTRFFFNVFFTTLYVATNRKKWPSSSSASPSLNPALYLPNLPRFILRDILYGIGPLANLGLLLYKKKFLFVTEIKIDALEIQ